MAKKVVYCVLLGVLIGAVFGFGLDSGNGNALRGPEIGAFFGVFIGWFVAATTL
jgi:hypothetical protein